MTIEGWHPLVPPVLDDDQRAVVRRIADLGGCLLVTGGPGSGKTTTLVAAVAQLVALGVALHDVVVLTHSRPAAQRLRRQIMAAVGATQANPRITTVHGLCRALVDQYAEPSDLVPLRLLSAPEQEFRVRELIDGTHWPADLGQAALTEAFAGQLRALITRARQLGLDPSGLAAAGRACGRPEWVAAGRFFEGYLDVIDAEGVLDYAELVHRSRLLLGVDAVRSAVAAHTKAVLVDEFAESDESVVALLRDIWRAGVPVTAFADQTTCIFGFRGAWPAALRRFPEEFADNAGPAPVIELLARYRVPDEIEAWTADAPADEAAAVAQCLWQARSQGLPWESMAVVSQSFGDSLAALARGLATDGVPVRMEGESLALAQAPAVRVLLDGLELLAAQAAGLARGDAWLAVLGSPLVGLDEVDLRRLVRLIDQFVVTDDDDALVTAVLSIVEHAPDHAAIVDALPPDLANVWRRLVDAVGKLVNLADTVASSHVSELAWGLWQLGDWPARLQRASMARGADALRADRDLDAVIALFDLSRGQPQWRGAGGVAALVQLVAQQVVQRDRAREADDPVGVVTVLSAYRTKGRQWPVVVVTGAVEGAWPSRGAESSLLEPQRLLAGGQLPAITRGETVAAQRRLFTLAASRASHRLIVTGSPGSQDEPVLPSRFLHELGVVAQHWHRGKGRVPAVSQAGLVGELRAAALAPDESPGVVDEAIAVLRQLRAGRRADGRPLAPAADPSGWWWVGGVTASPGTNGEQGPIRVRASDVGSMLACPRLWFMQQRANASPVRGEGAEFGLIAHWLFDACAEPGLPLAVTQNQLDEIWASASFQAPWRAQTQRRELDDAVGRFVAWRDARPRRRLLGTEIAFTQVWPTPLGDVQVTGRVDRLEMDASGRLVVIDYKTKTQADVDEYKDQLGIYEVAVHRGAFEALAPGVRQAAPPELVWPRANLRQSDVGSRVDCAKVSAKDESWVLDRVGQAAAILRGGRFDAIPGKACRSCAFPQGCPAAAWGDDEQ